MKRITVTTTYIQIGQSYYPLNSLVFRTDGTNIFIFNKNNMQLIIQDVYSGFQNSGGTIYTTANAVIADLLTSFTIYG